MKGTRRGEVPATGRPPNEQAPHAAPRGADRTWLWMPAVLVAAGIGAYLGSFRGVFLFDDVRLIVENPNIRGLAAVWSSLPGDDRPLVSLSLALDYSIGGLNPWPYHLFNLVGHLLARLTLFGTLAVLSATGIAGLALNPARSPDQTLGLGYAGSTPVAYALTQPGVIVHYLRLALWPDPLCLDYGWPLATSARAIAPPLVLIGALLAATIASFRRRPELGFVGAWFFLLLAPTSSVIPVADAAF